MDLNYCKPLASILQDAQGTIDPDTGLPIDIGGHVVELRQICDRLRAELAECKRDAELWRAYQARKQAVIDAGMASNPMLAVAANMMCPFCHSMIGAPHELWCRHSALAAKGE